MTKAYGYEAITLPLQVTYDFETCDMQQAAWLFTLHATVQKIVKYSVMSGDDEIDFVAAHRPGNAIIVDMQRLAYWLDRKMICCARDWAIYERSFIETRERSNGKFKPAGISAPDPR